MKMEGAPHRAGDGRAKIGVEPISSPGGFTLPRYSLLWRSECRYLARAWNRGRGESPELWFHGGGGGGSRWAGWGRGARGDGLRNEPGGGSKSLVPAALWPLRRQGLRRNIGGALAGAVDLHAGLLEDQTRGLTCRGKTRPVRLGADIPAIAPSRRTLAIALGLWFPGVRVQATTCNVGDLLPGEGIPALRCRCSDEFISCRRQVISLYTSAAQLSSKTEDGSGGTGEEHNLHHLPDARLVRGRPSVRRTARGVKKSKGGGPEYPCPTGISDVHFSKAQE